METVVTPSNGSAPGPLGALTEAAAKERADVIGAHLKDCAVCKIDLGTRRVLSACDEGKKLLWGALEVEHDPKESPVAKALREELRRILDEPLTVARLRRVAELTKAAAEVLRAVGSGPEALAPPLQPALVGGPWLPGAGIGPFGAAGLGTYDGPVGPAMAPAPPIETFGTMSFREIATMARDWLQGDREKREASIEQIKAEGSARRVATLVEALARARASNVPMELQRKMERAIADEIEGKPAENPDEASVVNYARAGTMPRFRDLPPISAVVSGDDFADPSPEPSPSATIVPNGGSS